MELQKFQQVVKSAYDLLARDAGLYYHTWEHTAQVLEAADKICQKEGIYQDHTKTLLRTAIVAHDIGNIVQRNGHEDLSVKFARTNLPYFGYDNVEIEDISYLIKSTKTPQEPNDHLQRIICDADLSLIGYPEHILTIDSYRLELGQNDMFAWYDGQEKFLTSHKWWTQGAKELYENQKQININKIRVSKNIISQLLGKD